VTPPARPAATLVSSATSVPGPTQHGTWYLHLWASDELGNWGSAATYGPVRVDAVAPTAPVIGAPAATLVPKTGSVTVTWSASTDDGAGVKHYLVETSSTPMTAKGRTGPWSTVATVTSTTAKVAVVRGATSCVRVTAVDKAGHPTTSAQRCIGVPFNAADFTASKKPAWKSLSGAKYAFGSARTTSAVGASLTKADVKGKQVGLLVWRCPTCGSVTLQWGKAKPFATLSLKGKATKKPTWLFTKPTAKAATGTLIIKVASKGKPVTVDAVTLK